MIFTNASLMFWQWQYAIMHLEVDWKETLFTVLVALARNVKKLEKALSVLAGFPVAMNMTIFVLVSLLLKKAIIAKGDLHDIFN